MKDTDGLGNNCRCVTVKQEDILIGVNFVLKEN
jgi:hypothetical protein